MKRLTTDTPKGNFERLMNYAYTKNGRVFLSYAGGKYDIGLCEYVSSLSKDKNYNYSPEFIFEDGLLDDYDNDFAILYYCAIQAAQLREALKMYEDKIENGTLIAIPLKEDTEMTPPEAIKILDAAKAAFFGAINMAFDLAINALEKQIPIKPIELKNNKDLKIGASIWRAGVPVYKCPNCESFISHSSRYCSNCGQAIDRSK